MGLALLKRRGSVHRSSRKRRLDNPEMSLRRALTNVAGGRKRIGGGSGQPRGADSSAGRAAKQEEIHLNHSSAFAFTRLWTGGPPYHIGIRVINDQGAPSELRLLGWGFSYLRDKPSRHRPRALLWHYDFNVWSQKKRIEKLRYIHRNSVRRA